MRNLQHVHVPFLLFLYINLFSTAISEIQNEYENTANSNPVASSVSASAADHVSMTKEAADLRSQHLLRKKPMLKQSVSITSLLFPGSEPIEYKRKNSNSGGIGAGADMNMDMNMNVGEEDYYDSSIPMFVEYVESRKTPVGVDYSELPVCPLPTTLTKTKAKRKNLGQRLMGHSSKPLGYQIQTDVNMGCSILCHVAMNHKQLKLMRRLIRQQYRVHYTLDSLPILVRSTDLNHALRGYPLGFEITKSNDDGYGPSGAGFYLNNHLRFTIYYNQKTSSPADKVHITGFDVTPVSIQHSEPAIGWNAGFSSSQSMPKLSSCDPLAGPVQNKKETLLALRTDAAGGDLHVVYSYEVNWELSEVEVSI